MDTPVKLLEQIFHAHTNFIDQYSDDAAFLWVRRNYAINQPDYDVYDLKELDQRISILLNSLMTTPEESWKTCETALELLQPGEVFVAGVLAFRSLDVRKIQISIEAGLSSANTFEGLVSAMAWLPGRLVHSWIKKFLTSKDLNHKYLALAVCSARREDPREFLTSILQREDCLAHELLYARAIRLVGELKRFDLTPALRLASQSDNKFAKFWSLWSQVVLGDKSQAIQLQEWVFTENSLQRKAIETCFRSLPIDLAREWISQLAQNPAMQREVIHSTRVLGDPLAVNWLLTQMHVPPFSRLAGEAFSQITGLDLAANNLILENIPELDNQLPNDGDGTADESLEVSEDQQLPFPDINKIEAVWQKYHPRFAQGKRYFMGQMMDGNPQAGQYLRHIYQTGTQRQRASAALELSLLESSHYLLNHAAMELGDE